MGVTWKSTSAEKPNPRRRRAANSTITHAGEAEEDDGGGTSSSSPALPCRSCRARTARHAPIRATCIAAATAASAIPTLSPRLRRRFLSSRSGARGPCCPHGGGRVAGVVLVGWPRCGEETAGDGASAGDGEGLRGTTGAPLSHRLRALVRRGDLDEALRLVESVPRLDGGACAALVKKLCASGRTAEARRVLAAFDPDVVAYNAMVAGYCGAW
ncbi:hypothetical protein E2562_008648 [Oryza meyeriana var. granulata]|uniref:Pentatricopeptide repeat-containing protein n=1 Tax=Oryza meyeriana var. granulata TaxID=110450 RepID=A0A6G1F5G4_9ORYZ|nr:hypothetical protein E2562_008648 [Oryza meyeriana var. granulata]